jgi:hypothetical protein
MRLGGKVAEEGQRLKSWIKSGVVAGVRRVEFEGTENLEAGDGFLPNLAISLQSYNYVIRDPVLEYSGTGPNNQSIP